MSADYDIEARDEIARMDRRMRDMEARLAKAERDARTALDDVRHMEDRLRYVEQSI